MYYAYHMVVAHKMVVDSKVNTDRSTWLLLKDDMQICEVFHVLMEYYLALKKTGILTHATTWKTLEDIMLSEVTWTQKGKYLILFI